VTTINYILICCAAWLISL